MKTFYERFQDRLTLCDIRRINKLTLTECFEIGVPKLTKMIAKHEEILEANQNILEMVNG